MKLFLDTALLEEIKEAADTGLIDGVTTNPSLIAKSGRKLKDVISEICQLVNGPISAEVIGTSFEDMTKEAMELSELHENVVVKVPLTRDGLKTVSHLSPRGIKFNVTLCFNLGQALLAAKAGATFISPFIGRLDDIHHHGLDLIPDIIQVYDNYGYETEVLAASIRSPLHVTESALAGAHIATLPLKVFRQLYKHPLTDLGLAKFLADHQKSGD